MNKEKLLERLIELQDKVFDLETTLNSIDHTIRENVQILSGLKATVSLEVEGSNDFLKEITPVYNAITAMQKEITGICDGKIEDEIMNIMCSPSGRPSDRAKSILNLFKGIPTEG